MPEDPPSAQVTQKNGMGLTAPIGQNCTIEAFTSGKCLKDLQTRMKQADYSWSAAGGWPSQKSS